MKNYLAKFKQLNSFILTALSFLSLSSLFIPSAVAGTLTGPSSSSTGNYTIASTGNVCGNSYLSYRLNENNVTVQSGCSISKSFSGKPTGIYNYSLLECEYDSDVNYSFCAQIHSHSVTVARAAGANPNENAEVRLGDYNNDGLADIFVKSDVAAPYILKRTPYNSFQLITGLSVSQVKTYSTWGFATQILAYVSDLNIDGTDDMMLIGINNHIPAAADQIIHSQYNGSINTAPVSTTAVTDSTKRFLVETLGLSQDRNYLLRTMVENGAYSIVSHGYTYAYFNTAYLQIFQMGINGSVYVGLDENPYDDTTQPSSCVFYSCIYDTIGGQWQMYVYAEVLETTWDYSIFHPSVVDLDEEIIKVENGQSTLDNLLDIFERHVGYVSCSGIPDDAVDVFDNVHSFGYFRTNTCTFTVLARYLNSMSYKEALEAAVEKENKQIQFRARKLFNLWFQSIYHAVLSMPSPSKDTVSGMPDIYTDTLLEGRLRERADARKYTLFAGFVKTPDAPDVAFTKLQLAVKYYNTTEPLPYNPRPLPYSESYNSNSFVQGLVNLVGTIDMVGMFGGVGIPNKVEISNNEATFPGILKPVPKHKFGY